MNLLQAVPSQCVESSNEKHIFGGMKYGVHKVLLVFWSATVS